jgi:hypothetical protein
MKGWAWWVIVAAVLIAVWLWIVPDGSDSGDGGASDGGTGVEATILSALSSFENVATQHNNPGGICGSFIGGICQGPATFDSLAQGTDAAISLIASKLTNNPEMTVSQFVANWSGATGQVLTNYVNAVAGDLGLDPNEPIADAGGGSGD